MMTVNDLREALNGVNGKLIVQLGARRYNELGFLTETHYFSDVYVEEPAICHFAILFDAPVAELPPPKDLEKERFKDQVLQLLSDMDLTETDEQVEAAREAAETLLDAVRSMR